MRLGAPLIPGRLVRRYQRFLADVLLDDGGEVTAHCPNPGRMLGLNGPGLRVWLSSSSARNRRLPLTLELVEADGGLVGINTMHPNRLVAEAVREGRVPELAGYTSLRAEVAYGERCRIDLLLRGKRRPDCYVEVKNVHLKRSARAEFPDAVTARGVKHLRALAERVAAGDRAMVVYVVQRTDCVRFKIADDIDPAYSAAFRQALAAGVETTCRSCRIALDEIRLAGTLPVVL